MKQLNLHELEQELREVASPAEVAGLLKLAESISTMPQPTRNQNARSATREHVLAGAQSSGVRRSWFGGWIFALAPALAAAMVLVVATVASSATPGQPLYSVKRLTENAQLAVALTPTAKAEHCSVNMRRRAEELAALAPGQSDSTVEGPTVLAKETRFSFQARFEILFCSSKCLREDLCRCCSYL